MTPLEQFAQASDVSLQVLLQQPKEVLRFLSRTRKNHNLMQHATLFVEWSERRHDDERPPTIATLEQFAACCDASVEEICKLDGYVREREKRWIRDATFLLFFFC